MADLQLYTKATVYINSGLLSQESSVSIDRNSGSSPVDTVANGYSGESPGSPKLEISIDNAVPSADFELNPGSFMKLLTPVEISIFAAGRTLTTTGFVYADNFTHAVNTPAKITMKLRAKFTDWE